MRPDTVDLLRIRDGEPVDAEVRAAVDSNPSLRAELDDLIAARLALRALPTIAPPGAVWSRVAARLALDSAPQPRGSRHWPARAAIAAGVAALALWGIGRMPDELTDADAAPATIVADGGAQSRPLLGTPTYASLVEESARLERALDGLNYRPRVVRAGTAAAISSLEDRIAWIDERLTFSRALGLNAAEKRALYRQRIDLLDALYKVRYAEAQRFSF